VYGDRRSPDEALRTFGGRMSRAVPMDELLLQLVETLRSTMHLSLAEIWTGADGQLVRAVSVPERGPGVLELDPDALSVVARAHAQGNAWLQVWAPQLLHGRGDHLVRSVSVTHLGQLLGLIVLQRPADDVPFSDDEDRVLVELARQVGLALHNVRLDSALQASLEELQLRNAELVASRARIVAAADESRRQIERNLHDGAQQHLVALAVKVGLISTLMGSDAETAHTLLDELRGDVQATLTELRELAHGIYPPLLRDRGLGEALQAAANRAVLPTTVHVVDDGRHDSEVEAAIYFCCLEAVQNAGKHAGVDARIDVSVGRDDDTLWFRVVDDGAGFEVATGGDGQGFVNMRDRLGALGGSLTVTSVPGVGSTVHGTIPVEAV
jgi:signal transduction histidine kinase